MLNNTWDTALYEGKHAFVWKHGSELLDLLSPQPGENILDIGCGTGQLTAKIADAGAMVMGIDADKLMVDKAKSNYPNLEFTVADARSFAIDSCYDAVFSNAVLHWIPQTDASLVVSRVHQALSPGGRFVAEFGGKGNIHSITEALYQVLAQMDFLPVKTLKPWYFPSIAEYTTLLESHNFDVTYAVLFHRPTPLSEGDAGLRNWLLMFASRFFTRLTPEQQNHVIEGVERQLRPVLYHDGIWTADYRRLRIVAIK